MKSRPRTRGVVAPPSTVFKYYAREIRRQRGLFALVIVGTLGMQAASLVSPLLLRQFFNTLIASAPTGELSHRLTITIGWIALVLFCGWAARRVQAYSVIYLEARAMGQLYEQAFAYLLGHSYQFFVSQFAGTLTRRISKYASAFETIFDGIMTAFVPTFVYVCGAIVVLFFHNHTLGIVLALWALIFFTFQVYVSRLRQPLRDARAEADSALTGALSDAISNQNTITLFSALSHELVILRSSIARWYGATMRSWLANDYIWSAQSLLMVGINVGLLWGALIFWERGQLTVGDFVLIQTYLLGIFDNLNNLTPNLRRFYDAIADAGEMAHFLELPHGVADVPGALPLSVSEGRIDFKHVGFYFRAERPILGDFDLSIKGGEKVALVGPSGAGKSTITKLLLRLYDVQGGAIEIDGQNIARVAQGSLREKIAFVPQEPVLFHRTLLENIRYGRFDATDEEVIAAAKQAHCDEFISSLSHGYDTYVGERGVRLSGGERQRIAIARAILRDAPILVLDEATSSLDSESESLIQESLATLMRGKTVVVIAHRLSTIMKMDRIVVVEKGRIAAQGTHQELLSGQGLYNKLWNIQAGGFLKDE